MREQFFDDLAKGLDDGTISRRRALKLAGGALLAAVVPSVFPPLAVVQLAPLLRSAEGPATFA